MQKHLTRRGALLASNSSSSTVNIQENTRTNTHTPAQNTEHQMASRATAKFCVEKLHENKRFPLHFWKTKLKAVGKNHKPLHVFGMHPPLSTSVKGGARHGVKPKALRTLSQGHIDDAMLIGKFIYSFFHHLANAALKAFFKKKNTINMRFLSIMQLLFIQIKKNKYHIFRTKRCTLL